LDVGPLSRISMLISKMRLLGSMYVERGHDWSVELMSRFVGLYFCFRLLLGCWVKRGYSPSFPLELVPLVKNMAR
jgi:hypothetical protein